MLKKSPRYLSLFPLIVVLFLVLFSCKKDTRVLDTGVQPDSDLLATSPPVELAISGFTTAHDSILSFNDRFKFLGSNNDPVFGRTDVGLYLNANFSQTDVDFGPEAELVSAELIFNVANAGDKGKLDALLTFSVFPLDSALIKTRIYYSSNNRLHNPVALPTQPVAGVSVMSGTTVLRVALDSAFASGILKDKAALVNNTVFQSKYKGLYIAASADNDEGRIFTCDLEGPLSGLYLYYKKTPADTVSSFRFMFGGDRAVRYNTVKHDHSSGSAELNTQLSADSSASPAHWFLQGLGGTKVKMSVPITKNTSATSDLAVHRAELILKVDPSFVSNNYGVPPHLALLAISATGKDTIITDQQNVTDNVRYGGSFDAANNQYVFNIARHAQAVMNGGKINRGFYLVVADPEKTATLFRDEVEERVVLGGPGHSSLRPRFTLSYSRISVK